MTKGKIVEANPQKGTSTSFVLRKLKSSKDRMHSANRRLYSFTVDQLANTSCSRKEYKNKLLLSPFSFVAKKIILNCIDCKQFIIHWCTPSYRIQA